jgi:hypothetical protein
MARYKVTTEDGKSYAVTTEDSSGTDWKQVVSQSSKDIFQRPLATARNLGTNPEAMANAMPGAIGTAMGMAFPFGGATGGTALGQGIRYGALKALGKPTPEPMQYAKELGGSVLGDIASGIGQSKYFGGKISQAETDAGVKALEKVPPPSQARTAVVLYQKAKAALPTMTPMEARQLKPAFDWIARKGVLGKSEYAAEFFETKKAIDGLVNQIPGRGAAASQLGRVYTVPRMMGRAIGVVPKNIQRGVSYGAGQGLGGGVGWEVIRRLLGG